MSKDIQPLWMFSPNSFVSLLGAEYHLMSDAGVLKRFYISALLIIIILLLTLTGIYYALDLLFHALVIEIILTIFFCLLFLGIYIFLLNTFAKENRVQKGIFNTSNIIRIGFVAFMGFLIAQPLIIMLYAATLSPVIENHKHTILYEHTVKIDGLMKDEMATLSNEQLFYTNQKVRFGTTAYDKYLDKIADKMEKMRMKTMILKQTAQQTIDNNSFFLFRVQNVNRNYSMSWLLAFLIILLFLLPGYLIYSISSQHEYYQLKKAREKELVVISYKLFTERYKTMFHEQVTIFSRYEDPPFNTVRKQPPVPASMTEFLQKYLENG
jgi:hypothetical protein